LKVLFDQGTPVPLRTHFTTHHVSTAYELGWSTLKNGELLAAAESNGFDVFITTDANLAYQQNLSSRKIAIVVLSTTSWPRIQKNIQAIVQAVDTVTPNSFQRVAIN
jgi:hypothetical protein